MRAREKNEGSNDVLTWKMPRLIEFGEDGIRTLEGTWTFIRLLL